MNVEPRRIGPGAPGYPVGLTDMEQPPRLYVAGSLSEETGIAVVGTRRCTRYGIGLAEGIGAALARSGWTTVSGLARGIDVAAHRGCLGAGGRAVAVLGSGVDVCYPAENRPIFDQILESGGAMISEYPPGTRPDRWRFPAGNSKLTHMRTALYARISRDPEDQKVGVDRQLVRGREVAEAHGWTVVETFTDNDASGFNGDARA